MYHYRYKCFLDGSPKPPDYLRTTAGLPPDYLRTTSGLLAPASSCENPVFPEPYKRGTATPPDPSSHAELKEITSSVPVEA